MFITQGIGALPAAECSAICEKVETFDSFTEDNDPHGEHDFGTFEHNGRAHPLEDQLLRPRQL